MHGAVQVALQAKATARRQHMPCRAPQSKRISRKRGTFVCSAVASLTASHDVVRTRAFLRASLQFWGCDGAGNRGR